MLVKGTPAEGIVNGRWDVKKFGNTSSIDLHTMMIISNWGVSQLGLWWHLGDCCVHQTILKKFKRQKKLVIYRQYHISWNCYRQISFLMAPLSIIPDSKDHGTNMGHIWVLSAAGGSHVGPMNLAIRDVRCIFSANQDAVNFPLQFQPIKLDYLYHHFQLNTSTSHELVLDKHC